MQLGLIDVQFIDSAPINTVHGRPSSSVAIMSSPANDDFTGITWLPPNDAAIIGEDHRVWTFPGDTIFRDNVTYDDSNDSDSSNSGCSTSMLFSDTCSNSDDSTELQHNPTKQEKKAFKESHPQSLKLTREDRDKKETTKHNRKDRKLQRFLKVCVLINERKTANRCLFILFFFSNAFLSYMTLKCITN